MRFVFVRHGQSEANLLNVFANRDSRHPLTERGRQDMRTLADALVGRGVVEIYTSPLTRAVESAEIIRERVGVPCHLEPALRDYDVGIYEGRSDRDAWQEYDAVAHKWAEGKWGERLPGGESCFQIHARFVPFIERLIIQSRNRPPESAVLLMSHGTLYRHALPAVMENVTGPRAMHLHLPDTGTIEAEVVHGHNLRCLRWGDVEMS